MQRSHSDCQILESQNDAFTGLLAFYAPNGSRDLKRHGEDRNVVAEPIYEQKASLLSLLVRGSKSTMRQLGNRNHGKPKLGLSPGCLDLFQNL